MLIEPKLWRLDGQTTTLLLVQDHGVPRLVWFGDTLSSKLNISQLQMHDDSALAFGSLDAVTPLSLFPQASTGYTGSPALNGHRNGKQFAHCLTTTSVRQSSNTLYINLTDEYTHIEVSLELSLHPQSDVVSLQTTLRNVGNSAYTVDWIASATMPLPGNYRECLTQHGRWGLENQTHRRHIAPGRIDISNLHGRTSHEHSPGLACGTAGFGNDHGDVTFAQLAWSGNFSLRVERLSNGNVALQSGVLYLPGECILQSGESLTTPVTSFTRGSGMNACTQQFHRYARQAVLPAWTRTQRPIHANSWEALYFNHDSKELFELIDAAAGIGAERFVLDDGWFKHRRDDTKGLGDWYVDESIYPQGLTPIVNHVRQHGMQFGLWFEPEMVNPNSDLYRAHPEWALHVDNIQTPLARDQLVLDIARKEVSDYLFERITSLVHEYNISYIKWDHNRDLVLPGDGSCARAAKQPEALYTLLARILATCPGLEIETCSSGGARCDLGVLQHTGRVWTSDNIDPIERTSIQCGFQRFFPPEIMGAHVGHKKAHLTGRDTSLHTRAVVALQGQYGFELDARKLDDQDVITLKHYTELYKAHRHWLSEAVFWQLTTHSKAVQACGNVEHNQQQALYSVVVIGNMHSTRAGHLPLSGLDPNANYTLALASANKTELAAFNKVLPPWCEAPQSTRGELLMKIGVPLPVMPPQSALLIHCEQHSTS